MTAGWPRDPLLVVTIDTCSLVGNTTGVAVCDQVYVAGQFAASNRLTAVCLMRHMATFNSMQSLVCSNGKYILMSCHRLWTISYTKLEQASGRNKQLQKRGNRTLSTAYRVDNAKCCSG